MHPCEHTLHYCHRSYGRSRASLSSRPPTDRAALPASKSHRRVVEAHWPQKSVTRHTLLVIFFSLARLSSYPSLSSVAISPMPVCVCVCVCVCACAVCACVCACASVPACRTLSARRSLVGRIGFDSKPERSHQHRGYSYLFTHPSMHPPPSICLSIYSLTHLFIEILHPPNSFLRRSFFPVKSRSKPS